MDAPSKYGHLRKENFLSDRPVFVNQAYSDTLFKPETAFPHMHIHDFVELSMVISGEGYHRTLNDLTACAPGDVYVINTGAPHAYFIKEKGDTLVVRNLIFDPSDILDAELSVPESPRYCCGLFREDPMMGNVRQSSLAGHSDHVQSPYRRKNRNSQRQNRSQASQSPDCLDRDVRGAGTV